MRRPNILILYTDQQRWDTIAALGNDEIHTPNLDRLAGDGVAFDHCFVQNPVCMPSRISMLTGQYPSTLRITHMGVPVPDDVPTFPKLFGPSGYHTANLGKLHFLPHANRDHAEPHPDYGFDHLEISDEPGCYEDAYRAWVRMHAPDQMDHLSVGLPPARPNWLSTMHVHDPVRHPNNDNTGRSDFKRAIHFPGRDDVTHTAFVGARTCEFIEQQGDRPFACIAGFYSPHSPWVAPKRFHDLYKRDRLSVPPFADADEPNRGEMFSDEHLREAKHGYYAMISEVDHHVGRILDTLEAQGHADDTIVVFTSDHGEWLGEHGKWGKGHPGNDACSRVPLLIRYPERISNTGLTDSNIVEAVDILPTLMELAGMQVAPHLQGRSLAPLLAPSDRAYEPKDAALMEHHGWKNLRTRDYRYLVNADGREQLWHVADDPWELHDVVADPAHASALADMRHAMVTKLTSIERPLERTWCY